MKRITYQIMSEVNHGTEEQPDIQQIFNEVMIECGEDVFESNFATAQREAYNGEVTVEDIEDPIVEPTQLESDVETLKEENSMLKAQINAQSEQMDFYEDCIAEMATVVYA